MLTPTAESAYREIHEQAQEQLDKGNTGSPKVKLLRLIDDCIDKIIPADPLAKERALSGALSGLFRVKQGRTRICYCASSKHNTITILYISETLRKEGDKNDPYAIFTGIVMSGRYDEVFEKLGLRRPQRKSLPPPSIQ